MNACTKMVSALSEQSDRCHAPYRASHGTTTCVAPFPAGTLAPLGRRPEHKPSLLTFLPPDSNKTPTIVIDREPTSVLVGNCPPTRAGTLVGMSPLLRRTPRKKPTERTVTLIGKPDCHLCEDAEAVVEEVCGELGTPWEKKDITQDEELYRAYWEQIPVVLIDGEQHDFWRVNPQRLRTALGG